MRYEYKYTNTDSLKTLLDANDLNFHFLPCEFIVLDSRETHLQNHNVVEAIFNEKRGLYLCVLEACGNPTFSVSGKYVEFWASVLGTTPLFICHVLKSYSNSLVIKLTVLALIATPLSIIK